MNQTDVKTVLRTFICDELLGQADYALADNEAMITGGLIDSFSLAQIGVFIEDRFGVYIPDTELTVTNMDTLNQLVARVVREEAA